MTAKSGGGKWKFGEKKARELEINKMLRERTRSTIKVNHVDITVGFGAVLN